MADGGQSLGRPALETIGTIAGLEARYRREQGGDCRFAERLVKRISTGWFLAAELSVIAFWFGFNALAPAAYVWDRPPCPLLGILIATQGVTVTTLLLIRTAGLARHDTERAHLSMHIALLSERKMTRMIQLQTLLLERGGLSHDEIAAEVDELIREGSVDDTLAAMRSQIGT